MGLPLNITAPARASAIGAPPFQRVICGPRPGAAGPYDTPAMAGTPALRSTSRCGIAPATSRDVRIRRATARRDAGSAPDGERIVGTEDRRPLEADLRQVAGEHILAVRPNAALDPCDEIIERL